MDVDKEIKRSLKFLENFSPQTVLDLGCGDGSNSLRFAELGAKVTGVDKKRYQINNVNFNFIETDITNFKFEKNYDLIIACCSLHFLNKQKALRLIKDIKKFTNNKGLNFIVCFSNKDTGAKILPKNFFPTLNELEQIYKNFNILKKVNGFTRLEEHDNLAPHKHNVIILIIQKKINKTIL